MLKRFTLKNYRNFKDEISINFTDIAGYQFNTDCIEDGVIRKMLIYGRNATGKTNLGEAIMDIYFMIFYGRPENVNIGVLLNADSLEKTANFSYVFWFDGKELIYSYALFFNQELQKEELIIDGTTIFKCDFDVNEYNFENLNCINAETANTEVYLRSFHVEGAEKNVGPKLPFLRWLISNAAWRDDSIILKLKSYISRMMGIVEGVGMRPQSRTANFSFNQMLETEGKLQDFENFLNAIGIECKLTLEKLPDGQYELYFVYKKLVPFSGNASSGTMTLTNLYQRLISKAWEPSFLYWDEFDAFYHYEMAENIIKFFKKRYPKCQMIMTTHNTNLMTNRLMRPDCVFILSRTGTLTALCNATQRELREGHSLEKMYISGEFEQYE